MDISDTTQAPTGTTKKMTTANLFTSPSMTGVLTVAGGVISGGSVVVNGGAVNFSNVVGRATVIGGTTGTSIRNTADSADNLLVTDAGAVTVRSTLAVTGGVTCSSTLAVTGDVTIGATTLTITASSGSILSAGSVQAGGRGTFQNSLIFSVGGAGGGVPFSWLSTIATATVSSSAVALSSLTFGKGGLVMVYGTDGTNKFLDLVLYGATTTTVISSTTVAAAPVARTYSMAASTLKLAMASGSYLVDTTEIAKGN